MVVQADVDHVRAVRLAGHHHQVGLAGVLTRLQHRGDRHAGQVARVQQGAVEFAGVQGASAQTLQRTRDGGIAVAFGTLHQHPSKAAFQHLDAHHAVLAHLLRGHVGGADHEAGLAVGGSDRIGHRLQLLQRDLRIGRVINQPGKRALGKRLHRGRRNAGLRVFAHPFHPQPRDLQGTGAGIGAVADRRDGLNGNILAGLRQRHRGTPMQRPQ